MTPDRDESKPGHSGDPEAGDDSAAAASKIERIRLEADALLARVHLTRAEIIGARFPEDDPTLRATLTLDAEPAAVRTSLAAGLLPQYPREALAVLEDVPAERRSVQDSNLRGVALMLLKESARAERAFHDGLTVDPRHVDLHVNLATLHLLAQRYEKAIRRFSIVARMAPGHAAVAQGLFKARESRWASIKTLLRDGRTDAAEPILLEALADTAGDIDLLMALGHLYAGTGRPGKAIGQYRRVLQLDRTRQRAWFGVGTSASELGEFAIAARCLAEAIALDDDDAEAHHNLARAYHELGRTDDALHHALRAELLELDGPPTTLIATVIPGAARATPARIRAARERWAAGLPRADAPPRPPTGELRRIGYVSSFFGAPGWMKPVWALLDEHDRDRYEIHWFSDAPASMVRTPADHDPRDRFHDITGMDNREVARLVAESEVDLLVDLNGYSDLERLSLFSLRPAPVNVAWFNMYATSGIDTFDAIIGDSIVLAGVDPEDFVEPVEIVDACYLSFDVRYDVPDVVPSPHEGGAPFTFGALATRYKITPDVIAAWSAILRGVPDARLLVRNTALTKPMMRRDLEAAFAGQGVDGSRLLLLGAAPHRAYLETYGRIDVALDTFPYNGGTTTMEALWQGVPVLAMLGDRWASRISASLLHHGGMQNLIADAPAAFVRLGIELASPGVLEDLVGPRLERRERLAASPLCRAIDFARSMEASYRRIWSSAR